MSEKEEFTASLQETKSALEATRQASQATVEESGGLSKAERDRLSHNISTLQEEMQQMKEHNAALVNKCISPHYFQQSRKKAFAVSIPLILLTLLLLNPLHHCFFSYLLSVSLLTAF